MIYAPIAVTYTSHAIITLMVYVLAGMSILMSLTSIVINIYLFRSMWREEHK